MQTIRFQLNRKMQLQAEEEQKKSQKTVYPERDVNNGNEFMQQKLKKLYE